MKARTPSRAAETRAVNMPQGGVAEALDAGVIDRLPSCAVGASSRNIVLKRLTHAKTYSKAVFLRSSSNQNATGTWVVRVKRRSMWKS
jgi:hypothetical protein